MRQQKSCEKYLTSALTKGNVKDICYTNNIAVQSGRKRSGMVAKSSDKKYQ